MFPEEISDYEYLFAEEEIKYTYLPECIFKEIKNSPIHESQMYRDYK